MLCDSSFSAQVYNVTADSTLSRKRRVSDGEDASVAKKLKQPADEDSEAEDVGEEAGVCGLGVVQCVVTVNALGQF